MVGISNVNMNVDILFVVLESGKSGIFPKFLIKLLKFLKCFLIMLTSSFRQYVNLKANFGKSFLVCLLFIGRYMLALILKLVKFRFKFFGFSFQPFMNDVGSFQHPILEHFKGAAT